MASASVKGFNKTVFLLGIGVFSLLMIPSFIAAAAQDEGTLGNSLLGQSLCNLFLILRFPTHTLLWPVIGLGGFVFYFVGLFTNCMFYALIVERLFYYYGQMNSRS